MRSSTPTSHPHIPGTQQDGLVRPGQLDRMGGQVAHNGLQIAWTLVICSPLMASGSIRPKVTPKPSNDNDREHPSETKAAHQTFPEGRHPKNWASSMPITLISSWMSSSRALWMGVGMLLAS